MFAVTFLPSFAEYSKSPYLHESECETDAVVVQNVF
jgi:hypothetical protein